ncbi:NADH-quinone oxidoreductase subunit N [Patulibacter defluvii]|uniref:NADH-quinone oxidoreductase subunit N n=1 Tax=Patulibacter defluvii TaxID=3095358 RepID=UPI002A75D597|nr:NADH-quinone oxidoreductase subunit N [Patulibacter sp. DM4]
MSATVSAAVKAPHIDWAGFSPVLALFAGAVAVLLVGLLRSRFARERAVPFLSIVAFAAAVGLAVWQWDERGSLISGALALDPLALIGTIGVGVAGIAAVLLAVGATAPREAAHGEFHALLLVSAAGMALFAGAQNLITTFLGLELLSVPLYVLAATELYRRRSLESGLKYLIVGSVGSATLLYGFALIYGATGFTDYAAIAQEIGNGDLRSDPLLLGGVAMVVVGLCFKASVAPFHQWTPDVYEGAPTSVTAFMATATKVATLIAMIRLFDVALPGVSSVWGPALAALAAIAMIVGNVGALGQGSVKRLLAFSSVAQAGYMLVGVVVASPLGAEATVFYVLAYLVMTAAAFAVVTAVERDSGSDHQQAFVGLGRRRPLHAVALTLSLLGLAGVPATVGFVAKLRLIEAAVDGDYAWLAVVLVIGSMISFAYYLRLIARVWAEQPAEDEAAAGALAVRETPQLAGADPAGDAVSGVRAPVVADGPRLPVSFVAAVAGAAVVVLGILPGPLMDTVEAVGRTLPGLL